MTLVYQYTVMSLFSLWDVRYFKYQAQAFTNSHIAVFCFSTSLYYFLLWFKLGSCSVSMAHIRESFHLYTNSVTTTKMFL